MHYDPIKNIFAKIIRQHSILRTLFYKLLGIMFLREWFVKREISLLFSNNTITHIYDAGMGYGQYTYFMHQKNKTAQIIASDLKQEQVKDCENYFKSKSFNNINFFVEDLTSIKHNNCFDLILSVDVMEHIEEDIKVFNNFYNALKNGGYLLVNTPSNLGGSDVHSEEDESFVAEHARNGYGFEEIQTKLKSCGFKIEKIRYTYGFFGTLAWKIAIKYPLLMLNTSKIFFVVLPVYYTLTMPLILSLMYLDFITESETGTGLIVLAKK